MQALRALLLACVTACAANSQLPQPASFDVDPDRDVVIVPHAVCPKFGGWIAMTEDAVRLDEHRRIEERVKASATLSVCEGRARIAETKQRQAEEAAESNGWLARWGLPLGFGGGVALTTFVSLVLVSLGGK